MGHEENVAAYRDLLIANAVKARKIAAARASDYRRLFDASPQAISHLLTAPVEQGGLMAGINMGGEPFPSEPTEYPRQWIAGSRERPSVMFEDFGAALDGISHAPPASDPRPGGGFDVPPAGGAIPGVTIEP
jgi:hypothetical protein